MGCAVCGAGGMRELPVCVDCGRPACALHGVEDASGALHHGECPPAEGFPSNMARLQYEERRRAAADRIAEAALLELRATRELANRPRLHDAARVLSQSSIHAFALFETRDEVLGRLKKQHIRVDTLIGLCWVVVAPVPGAEGYQVITENGEVFRGAREIRYCDDPTHAHTRQCTRGLGVSGDAARPLPPGDVPVDFMVQLDALLDTADQARY